LLGGAFFLAQDHFPVALRYIIWTILVLSLAGFIMIPLTGSPKVSAGGESVVLLDPGQKPIQVLKIARECGLPVASVEALSTLFIGSNGRLVLCENISPSEAKRTVEALRDVGAVAEAVHENDTEAS
jgi:hypothetical protein